MRKKRYSLKVLAVLLVVMLVGISCGTKSDSTNSIADCIEQICKEGSEVVLKASSLDEVQESYYTTYGEITIEICEEKIESADSIRISNALNTFLKVCCQKAREFGGFLKTNEGIYYMDKEGNVKCRNDESQSYQLDSPVITFKAYKLIFKTYQVDDEIEYTYQGLTVVDADGEVKYSDEDAEQYYDYYASQFFFAYKIAKACVEAKGHAITSYLQKNLFKIARNLPLDDSYPKDVKDIANKVYYDSKDKIHNMKLYKRGYGYVEYVHNIYIDSYGDHNIRCFKIYRDENSGNIMFGESTHVYNPNAN